MTTEGSGILWTCNYNGRYIDVHVKTHKTEHQSPFSCMLIFIFFFSFKRKNQQ